MTVFEGSARPDPSLCRTQVYQPSYDVLQLKEICVHLAADMAREGLRGKTLTVKLKSAATFEVRTSFLRTPVAVLVVRMFTPVWLFCALRF